MKHDMLKLLCCPAVGRLHGLCPLPRSMSVEYDCGILLSDLIIGVVIRNL